MKTAKIDTNLYSGAGYAVAAILGGQVVVACYVSDAVARKPTQAELSAAYEAVMVDPIYKAAKAPFEALPADASDDLIDALHVIVTSGMMSGGEFVYTVGLADKRAMGLLS